MNTELKGNAVFAAMFGLLGIVALFGASFCGATWHFYTFILSCGLVWTMLIARDDIGQSVWKCLKKFINENFEG